MDIAFQDIAGGPCGERLKDFVGILKHRHHQKLRGRALRLEFSNKFNAGNPRQLDIDDDRLRRIQEDVIEG